MITMKEKGRKKRMDAPDAPDQEEIVKRLHVGGLNGTVKDEDLFARFQPFGKVLAVDRKPGNQAAGKLKYLSTIYTHI